MIAPSMKGGIIAIVIGLASLQPAAASANPTVGAIVTGEPTLQSPVRRQIEAWARAHHFVAVDMPLGEHAKTLIDCFVIEDIQCAHGVFEKNATADGVFLVHVELVAGQTRELAFTGYWFVKGHDAVAEKRACKDCDDATQRATVEALLEALVKTVKLEIPREAPRGRSRLVPGLAIGAGAGLLAGGATYLYYGQQGGKDDPYRYPDATKLGVGLTVTGVLALGAGVYLWRKATPRERTIVPLSLLAAGAVALTGGAIALHYSAKSGPDAPYVYPGAAKIGAPLTIAGSGAIVAGTMLLVWGRSYE